MIPATHLARRLRHLLAGQRDSQARWDLHRAMFDQAVLIVACFYAMTAYLLYDGSRELSNLTDPLDSLDLLWPVDWFRHVGVQAGGQIIAQLGLAAGFLGIVCWRFIVVRIFVSARHSHVTRRTQARTAPSITDTTSGSGSPSASGCRRAAAKS